MYVLLLGCWRDVQLFVGMKESGIKRSKPSHLWDTVNVLDCFSISEGKKCKSVVFALFCSQPNFLHDLADGL